MVWFDLIWLWVLQETFKMNDDLQDPNKLTNQSSNTIIFSYNFQLEGGGGSQGRAFGQAAWLTAFWVPTQQRKHPEFKLEIHGVTFSCTSSKTSHDSTPQPDWKKLLLTALKKIEVQDLGNLSASELWNTIPEEDKEGRGRQDLERLEQQLSVKVVFLAKENNMDAKDGDEEIQDHILLVGAKKTLEKKCLVIRNMLSHYYWRLKGKEVHL